MFNPVSWREVNELRRRWERERLRSLSVAENMRQFVQLLALADSFPKWGETVRLRRQDTDELVEWRRKMDLAGRARQD